MATESENLESLVNRRYEHGFITDIATDSLPPGLDEGVVRAISARKKEPEWLLEWRLQAYRQWLEMEEPEWAHLHYPKIKYNEISYYSAPKSDDDRPKSLDEVDPKLLETYDKLGIPLHERARLAGVAVDAVFDSVSVATTFKEKLSDAGVIFCSFSEAVIEHPELVKKYLGTVVPRRDNYFAALNSAVFSDGSFVYIPKGVRCPMELSTYFRINAANTGQFERTLIVADEGSYVSYLEGCTAPMRDENQLHAAIVELVALDDAEIKYSTVQNWYPGDENGIGGIYNFVTKRGDCRGANSKISWTQVETGSAITWKYPSCLLRGENSVGEFYSVAVTNNMQQADTGTKMIHIGRNTRSTIVSKGISAGKAQQSYRGLVRVMPQAQGARNHTQCDSLLIGKDCGAHTFPVHGNQEPLGEGRTRSNDVEDIGEPAVLLPAARHLGRRCRQHDRQRLLQGSLQGTPDGICRRGTGVAERQSRRRRRLIAAEAAPTCGRASRREMENKMLEIKNLKSRIGDTEILRGLSLSVNAGEVHAIMGPNGSGKSTLAQVIAGHQDYEVTGGTVTFKGQDLLELEPEERAREGIFLGFQYPVEIPGVNNAYLLKAAVNAKRKHQGLDEIDAFEFLKLAKEKMATLGMDPKFLNRGVNEGFSGGEKKRNEILQMAMLEPELAILDETDSGLDIDALKAVAQRRELAAQSGSGHHARHALPAPARLHRAGFRARIVRGTDHQIRRQVTGARTRRKGYDWVREAASG